MPIVGTKIGRRGRFGIEGGYVKLKDSTWDRNSESGVGRVFGMVPVVGGNYRRGLA
jgi:hypothetical protein